MKFLRKTSTLSDGEVTLYDFKNLDEKLYYMRDMITRGRESPTVRKAAVEAIRYDCQKNDKKCQALTIGQWVQDNFYYVHEFPERLATAERTLKDRAGDCDDYTILIGAMCESIGIPIKQVVMKVDGIWKHVFPAAIIKHKNNVNTLLPIDATLKDSVLNVTNPIAHAKNKGKTVTIKLA